MVNNKKKVNVSGHQLFADKHLSYGIPPFGGFSSSRFHESSPRLHHWNVRDLCFLLRIPDTSVIENIIMSSHAPQIRSGFFVDEKSLESIVRFQPGTSGVSSRRANHWATDLRFNETYWLKKSWKVILAQFWGSYHTNRICILYT